MLLPCDIICEIPGETFLEIWMSKLSGLGADSDGRSAGWRRVGERRRTRSSTGRHDQAQGTTRKQPSPVTSITDNLDPFKTADYPAIEDKNLSGPAMEEKARKSLGHARAPRRDKGGLSVWYPTTNRPESVKGEECDFFGTVNLDCDRHRATPIRPKNIADTAALRRLVFAVPFSTLNDKTEQVWRVRNSLLRKHGAVKYLTGFRDAHIYFFPYWIKDVAAGGNDVHHGEDGTRIADFDSVSEDLIGTWAQTGWRKRKFKRRFYDNEDAEELSDLGGDSGTRKRGKERANEAANEEDEDRDEIDDSTSLGATSVTENGLQRSIEPSFETSVNGLPYMGPIEDEIDLMSLSSTQITSHPFGEEDATSDRASPSPVHSASRVPPVKNGSSSSTNDNKVVDGTVTQRHAFNSAPPPILSYIHSTEPSAPMIRRVDTVELLLSVSLAIARLPALDEFPSGNIDSLKQDRYDHHHHHHHHQQSTPQQQQQQPRANHHPSPICHSTKIAATSPLPTGKGTTITAKDTLIDHNAVISPQTNIRASVIGASTRIGVSTRLFRCVIMDGAVVDDGCDLSGCVIGRKARVGSGCMLRECEVQDGNLVAEGTEAEGEKFLIGGLEADDDVDVDDDDDDGDGERDVNGENHDSNC